MTTRLSHQVAFSLIELSIVLVILGLLVGGILAGQSLIHASELRSITTQHEKFLIAIQTFKEKFSSLPGDMPDATQYWGTATSCYAAATDSKTCDGNGDGKIYQPNVFLTFTMVVPLGYSETARVGQHLTNAGLIDGSYNGIDYPKLKINPTVDLVLIDFDVISYSTYMFVGEYNHTFFARGKLLAEDVWNMDTKVDDGKPATGKMVVYLLKNKWSGCTDATAGTTLSASYNLPYTIAECGFAFRQQF